MEVTHPFKIQLEWRFSWNPPVWSDETLSPLGHRGLCTPALSVCTVSQSQCECAQGKDPRIHLLRGACSCAFTQKALKKQLTDEEMNKQTKPQSNNLLAQ